MALGLSFVAVSSQTTAPNQEMKFRIYDSTGQVVALEDVIHRFESVDVVFVGETHDDPLAHFMELQLLRGANERFGRTAGKRSVYLSLEMFERDTQGVLDEYLNGLIEERDFLASSRPWKNYTQDYRPLVEFARGQEIPVIAANAPERYVRRVARLGRDSLKTLPSTSAGTIAPTGYQNASMAYATKFNKFLESAGGHGPGSAENMLSAQNLRDATMAYSISQALLKTPKGFVLHVTGSFHVEGGMGTPEQLKVFMPGVRSIVITVVRAGEEVKTDPASLKALGDFVVVAGP
jgi:uncharacterized iron-regulated protein